eukprot:scaffold128635_cov72-Phaeocystis_antarctica.AAC.2
MLRRLCTDRSDGPNIAGYDVDKGVARRPLDECESLAAVKLVVRAPHDLGDRNPREGRRVVRHGFRVRACALDKMVIMSGRERKSLRRLRQDATAPLFKQVAHPARLAFCRVKQKTDPLHNARIMRAFALLALSL